jgi:hypothetical protein
VAKYEDNTPRNKKVMIQVQVCRQERQPTPPTIAIPLLFFQKKKKKKKVKKTQSSQVMGTSYTSLDERHFKTKETRYVCKTCMPPISSQLVM